MADERITESQDQREGTRLGSRWNDPPSRWRPPATVTPTSHGGTTLLPQDVTFPADSPHHV